MFARITDNDVINAVKKCNLLSIYSFNKKMLFHYTSFEALQKILLSAPAKGKELCFRATRYDCFEDQTEFRYGIDGMMRYVKAGQLVGIVTGLGQRAQLVAAYLLLFAQILRPYFLICHVKKHSPFFAYVSCCLASAAGSA